jgi:sucrose phosphorylase
VQRQDFRIRMIAVNSQLRSKLMSWSRNLSDEDAAHVSRRIIEAFWPDGRSRASGFAPPGNTLWSEKDSSVVIAYGNAVVDGQHKPLDLLYDFLRRYLADAITGVHILPFFPFTSDDGFAVTDYEAVNSTLGDWADINRIGDEFRLMSDLVLNHMSSQSKWFNEYLQGHEPYDKYFFEASPADDLSSVVRPRAQPLLREVETANGTRHVWCTFSYDQVDLNYANPGCAGRHDPHHAAACRQRGADHPARCRRLHLEGDRHDLHPSAADPRDRAADAAAVRLCG